MESPKKPEANDFIVTGSLDDTVKVWNVKDKKLELRQQLSGHSLGVVSVAVSNDGSTIASSSLDSGLCIWSAETGQLLNQTALGPVDLWTVTFSPDGKYVISGSHEGKISLYSVETAKPEVVLDPQNGKFTLSIAYVSYCCFSLVPLLRKKEAVIDFFQLFEESRRKVHCQWGYRRYNKYIRCGSRQSGTDTRGSRYVSTKSLLLA